MKMLILFVLTVASVSFSFGKDFGEAQRDSLQQEVVVATTSVSSSYVGNPFIIEDLSADMHDSETIIPAYPDLPIGITYETTTTSSTTTTMVLPDGDCSEWYPVALDAGWSIDQLTKLGRIIFKESSCQHDVANKTYSYGLTQIEWSAHKGWLESEFGIVEREDLFDPYTNLVVARWLFDYAKESYGCGWQPWYMSGDWC
jgi:hypothetical protein